MDVPDDLPLVERHAVRLVVRDADDRVLLFHIREPLHPDSGSCWELPGGGIDDGESYTDAAVRELREETGLHVTRDDVGAPTWKRSVTFLHAGTRRLQDELVASIRLPASQPAIDVSQQSADELETFVEARWWTLADIESSDASFYPGSLPKLLPRFLEGETIDEPFEHFS